MEESKKSEEDQVVSHRPKRRSSKEIADYYIKNNPDAMFSKTLTGIFL